MIWILLSENGADGHWYETIRGAGMGFSKPLYPKSPRWKDERNNL